MPVPSALGRGGKPRLRDKLVAFFAANPYEELSTVDVMAKFDVDRSTAQQSVRHMREAGLLSDVQNKRGKTLVVCAGPALLKAIGHD